MYNLIVSGNHESWDGKPFELERGSRILREYTSEILTERFGKLDQPAEQALRGFPSLFAYEYGVDKPAHLGWITGIRHLGQSVRVEYQIDPILPAIPPNELNGLRSELDIEKLELYRTHWALKDVDLLAVLTEGGLIDGQNLRVLAAQSRTIQLGTQQRPVEVEARPIAFKIPGTPPEPDLVSVMMPFSAEFEDVYGALVAACKTAEMRCLRADHIWDEDEIMQDIFSLIYRSRVVICDFTNLNPNVFYETGIAHTLGRPVIPISQNISHVPFDLRHRRCLAYSNTAEGRTSLMAKVTQRLHTIRTRTE